MTRQAPHLPSRHTRCLWKASTGLPQIQGLSKRSVCNSVRDKQCVHCCDDIRSPQGKSCHLGRAISGEFNFWNRKVSLALPSHIQTAFKNDVPAKIAQVSLGCLVEERILWIQGSLAHGETLPRSGAMAVVEGWGTKQKSTPETSCSQLWAYSLATNLMLQRKFKQQPGQKWLSNMFEVSVSFFVVVCLLAPLAFIYCFHSNDSSTQGKVQTFALLWWNQLLSFGHRPTCPERIRVNLTGCDTRCFPWWKRAKQRGSRRQSLWVPSTLEESGDPKSLGTSLLGKVSLRAGLHFCWESCAEVCLAELAWGASSKMSHSSEK